MILRSAPDAGEHHPIVDQVQTRHLRDTSELLAMSISDVKGDGLVGVVRLRYDAPVFIA